MNLNVPRYESLLILAAVAGSTLGLLESTIWITRDVVHAIGPAITFLLDSYFVYALVAAVVTLPWWGAAVVRGWNPETSRATAVAIPFGAFLSVAVLSRLPIETTGELIVAPLASVSAGVLGYHLLRKLVLRFRILGLVETWLFVQSWFFLRIILLLTSRYETGLWKWPALAAALMPFGYFTREKFLTSGRLHAGWLAGLCGVTLGILASLPYWPAGRGNLVSAPSPNVLLITIDTLRADRLGSYGYAEANTPHLDRLAEEGVQFQQTIAPATETCPSHTSILSGVYPFQHGTLFNEGPIHADKHATTTVPEILASRGYRTAAFVSGATLSDAICGLSFRFDLFDENFSGWGWTSKAALKLSLFRLAAKVAPAAAEPLIQVERPATQTTDQAVRWLRTRGSHPFFLWVHYFDPHEPYRPPGEFVPPREDDYLSRVNGSWTDIPNFKREQIIQNPRDVDHMIDRYDGEIAYTDREIGRLFEELERLGLRQNTLVVVTADHGESLGEHDTYFDHVSNLYDENLRVPLILRFPGRLPEGKKVDRQTRLIDIAPTIIDLLGIQDERFEAAGSSLLPLLSSPNQEPERLAFAALYPEALGGSRSWGIYALRTESFKLIRYPSWWIRYRKIPEREELFDLRSDPNELTDILFEFPETLPELRDQLTRFTARRLPAPPAMSEEVKEQLKSLGYLD